MQFGNTSSGFGASASRTYKHSYEHRQWLEKRVRVIMTCCGAVRESLLVCEWTRSGGCMCVFCGVRVMRMGCVCI